MAARGRSDRIGKGRSVIAAIGGAAVKKLVIFDGNSLTAGFPGNATATGPNVSFPNGTDYPSAALRKLGTDWHGLNVGVSARQLDMTPEDTHISPPGSSQIEDFARSVAPRIREAGRARAACVIVVNFGEPGNLLYYATVDNADGGTRARSYAYEAVRRYGALVRAEGALFVQLTMPARVQASSQNRGLLEDLDAVNQMLRGGGTPTISAMH